MWNDFNIHQIFTSYHSWCIRTFKMHDGEYKTLKELSKVVSLKHNKVPESDIEIEMHDCWLLMVSSQSDYKSGQEVCEWTTHIVNYCEQISSTCFLVVFYRYLKCFCSTSFSSVHARRRQPRCVKSCWTLLIMRFILAVMSTESSYVRRRLIWTNRYFTLVYRIQYDIFGLK